MNYIVFVATAIFSYLIFLPANSRKSKLARMVRALCIAAIATVCVALARSSPQNFTALLGGLASTGLAILMSGWN